MGVISRLVFAVRAESVGSCPGWWWPEALFGGLLPQWVSRSKVREAEQSTKAAPVSWASRGEGGKACGAQGGESCRGGAGELKPGGCARPAHGAALTP